MARQKLTANNVPCREDGEIFSSWSETTYCEPPFPMHPALRFLCGLGWIIGGCVSISRAWLMLLIDIGRGHALLPRWHWRGRNRSMMRAWSWERGELNVMSRGRGRRLVRPNGMAGTKRRNSNLQLHSNTGCYLHGKMQDGATSIE
jgi:hypothetical protein